MSNPILPFGTNVPGDRIMEQPDFESSVFRLQGQGPGLDDKVFHTKLHKQAAAGVAALSQYLADLTGVELSDDDVINDAAIKIHEAIVGSIQKAIADGVIQTGTSRDINDRELLHVEWVLSSVARDPAIWKPCVGNSGLLARDDYPEAFAEIQRRFDLGDTAVTTDELWLSEFAANGNCPKFSVGDRVSTFRIPAMDRLSPVAPDSTVPAQTAGTYLKDQFQGHQHYYGSYAGRSSATGGIRLASIEPVGVNFAAIPSDNAQSYITDTAHGAPRVGDYTRGPGVVLIPMVKLVPKVYAVSDNGIQYWSEPDGSRWYVKHPNGWLEQGGWFVPGATPNAVVVTYLKPFAYPVAPILQRHYPSVASSHHVYPPYAYVYTTTGFTTDAIDSSTTNVSWVAYGQGAE